MKLTSKATWPELALPERWSRLAAYLWLSFGAVVLLVYYRQIWQIFQVGPHQWLHNNDSLEVALRPLWRFLRGRASVAYPPDFPAAISRALRAVAGAGAVCLAAQVYGETVLRGLHLRLEEAPEALLFRTALGFGAISFTSLGLAYADQYRENALRLLILLPCLAFIGWLIRRWVISQRASGFAFGKIDFHIPRTAEERAWIAISLAAFLLALLGALAPESEYDALWYHLWLPRLWLAQQRPVDIVSEYISLYPLTWELNYGAAMVLGGAVAARLLHWLCLPLTGLLVYRLSRRFFPQASAPLAVALFAVIPTVMWEATTAYNDLALAFYICLAFYAMLLYLEENRPKWLFLGAICLGLSLAIKHLALIVFALLSGGLLIVLWAREGDLRKAVKTLLLLAGISLLFPLPWYLRSWRASGNPFFPDLYQIFGAFPAQRWSVISEQGLLSFKNHFGDPRTLPNLLLLPWNVTIHAARYGGSLGPIFLILLPGALWVSRKSRGYAALLLAFTAGYVVLWASPISSFQLRFLVPITPLLAVLGALSFARLKELLAGTRFRSGWGQVLLAGLLLLNLPPFLSLHETDRQGYKGWLTHVIHEVPGSVVFGFESEESYLGRLVPSYQAWKYINQHLPQDALILTFSGGDNFYSQRLRLSSDATLARPATWGSLKGADREAIAYLRRLGVTHLLLDKRLPEQKPGAAALAILQPDILERYFVLEYQDAYFALYRLQE